MTDQTSQPPTSAEPLDLLPEPPKWPKVVGIISIVWSGIGLTCGGCGVGMMIFMPQLMKMAEQQMGGPPPSVMLPGPIQIALAGVGFLWAFVLLAAGIALVNRKPTARSLHLLYAAGAVVLTVVSTALQVKQMMDMQAWVQQNPADPWAKNSSPVGSIIGLAFGIVLGLAWPLFCLVWFGLVKRTAESITGGVEEPAA